ncbi:restriction endonuclease subunit S [Lactobacillus crispatus]|uniref:Restriction endonuclease subunit S n=1 Tax=Lactobacillus crispatus TaxID=47770 RepID=A0AAW8WJY0_9LACO|nr:restriction endonuclease subunit S [Lactobacillus crispatus]MDK8612816.1 restriction endonuclease subunit S [Lactobacillus crispatus]MDT9608903.1 restriction endonuclease subunit S [Lactobacillus crispatus]MDT9616091.1 restriction endonuclease subunit S [Lactobacillus crispatus]
MKTNTLDFDAQALREKILDLAMRGKLMPQDPNDEPASVLLKKIKAEKEQLIKEKKIKKSKPLDPITDDEKPFDIPDSWEWVRLGDVLSLENGAIRRGPFGSSLKKAFFVPKDKNTYKVYEQGNAINHTIDYGDYYISQEKYNELKSFSVRPKDIIISGAGTIGKTYILPPDTPDGVINQALIRVRLNDNLITNEFFLLAFQQKVSLLNKKAKGTAMKNMFSIAHMKNDLIWALPPLEEQSRIAAKIAQLFALLRKVESSTQQYAKLQTLLKSKVLDLAMRGKLVEQDPHDEPASVLLKKIKAEKEQLIKEGKMKKSKPLPPITDDEKPFDIPNSWEWVRLGDVITILRGGSPRPIKKYLTNNSSGINWIKIGDSKPNSKYIESATEKIIPEGLNKTREVHKGDFLLSNSMSFGRPYILKINGAVHDGWLVLSEYEQLFDKDYLYYLLSSSFINKQFVALATGSTVKNLNRERVANTIAVVPPLLEQKRIAVIIERLSPLLSGVEISL